MKGSVLFFLAFFIFSFPSFAEQEIPVKIKAEKLKYLEETGMTYASGKVEIELKDVKIYADNLILDSKTNILTAEGSVKMIAKDYTANAERINYDADREISHFSNFQAQTRPKRMKGPLFFEAQELTDEKEKMMGRAGKVTTCDYPSPHYFLLAERIEYYPEDKIVGWKVTTYVGRLPVLWMPYLIYDLKEKRKRNWVFGHNEVEGDFIKSAWGYPGGIFYLDLMQKKGVGYGFDADYGPLLLGLGTFYLYHLDEKDSGISDWIIKTTQDLSLSPSTKLKLQQDYTTIYQIPSGRLDQSAWSLNLNHQSLARWNIKLDTFENRLSAYKKIYLGLDQSLAKTLSQYYWNYEFQDKDPKWIRQAQRLYHERPLWKEGVTLYTTFNYYDNIASLSEAGDQRLDSEINLRGNEPAFSWSYSDKRYFDLDADRYSGDDALSFDEKKPELEIKPKALDFNLFSLNSVLGYGIYREVRYVTELGRMRDFETSRSKAELNANKNLSLPLGTTFGLGAGIIQYAYGPGDQLYAYQENLGLSTDLASFFKNEASYNRGYTEGNTPFFFDRLGTRHHYVRERLSLYYRDKFNWASWTGFNYLTNRYDDLLTELIFKPHSNVSTHLNTGWDIENRIYKDLAASLKLTPYSFFSADLSSISSLNNGELKSAHGLFNLLLLEGTPNQWQIRTSYIYDASTKDFKLRDIMVVKDLHCWEMKYTYSDYLKQFSLVISLQALPDEPVGISTTRGFYFEGFEKSLEELKGEEAVRRY